MESFKLPNARLLYKKNKLDNTWMKQLALLDQAIEEHPRLQRASDMFHVYFFKPGSELSSDDDIWVAREISGFVNPGELEGMETYDIGKGQGFGAQKEVSGQLGLNDLLDWEKELRQRAERELAPTWRVSFFRENGVLNQRIGLF